MSEKNTHVTTKPNAKPPTPIETLKKRMAGEYLTQITNYFSGDKEQALRFMTAGIEYVRRVPKLLECDQMSLMTAMVTAAQFRFMPSGVSGEAYIIPYGKEAKFQMGYQGIVTLLYRTNKIVGISANIIFKNDVFDYQEGLDAHLKHKPAFGVEKGEAIGVYTVVEMAGGSKTFKVMDQPSVMAIKNLSKAKGTKESPWNSDKDPEYWMWKKTCLIQHSKTLPKTQELVKALEADYKGEGIDKGNLDAGGPAMGKTFHNPENQGDNIPDDKDDFVPPSDEEIARDEEEM